MNRIFTKIPQNTFEGLQLEAGILLKRFDPAAVTEPADEDIICATTGGISVSCVATYSDQGEDVDNCPVNMMELKKLDGWNCRIGFTSLGMSPEMIRMSLGPADINESQVTPRLSLRQTDFSDLWWVGDKAGGGFAAVKLMNALSNSGFSLKTTKNGKGQVSVELMGHVSLEAQDVVPMEFYSTAGTESEVVEDA